MIGSTRRIGIMGLGLIWAAVPLRGQTKLEDLQWGQRIRISGFSPIAEVVWRARGPGQHEPDQATLAALRELQGQRIIMRRGGSDVPPEGVVGRLEGVHGDTILIVRDWNPGTVRVLASEGTVIARASFAGSVEGSFRSVTKDTLYVRTKGPSPLHAVPLAFFAEVDNKLEVHRGGHPVRTAAFLGAGVVGTLGIAIGYCFQIFADGCAADPGQALGGGALGAMLGAAAGGLVGLLISAGSDPFEEVLVSAAQTDRSRSAIRPIITPGGSVGLTGRIRVGGGR